ncbi:AzlD domain-containing protein [Alcaligenaceae bacterium CGII-47]|nr:AzlD domain-containing protein [Alcaligenaceae bacterium CGII-47]
MIAEPILIIILCGAGTFLLRFLPIWQTRHAVASTQRSKRMQCLLQGIGPAAIMALLVISLWPMLMGDLRIARGFSALAALTMIALFKHWRGGIALPTLAGALSYGVLMQVLNL